MNLIEIGSLIRQTRKAAKKSQAALARSLGMSRATISAIENGTIHEIGIRKVMALSAVLGLELSVALKRRRPTIHEVMEEHRVEKLRT
jgi:transcriptional regulator with XRE-family HTH domain